MTGNWLIAVDLEKDFVSPPDSARPWVYWFWLDGNITKEGITADLEAMKRQGIGGVLIMEVAQGTPKGPVDFASPQWRDMFKFVCSEANRLGLEVNMNNDAGWCGSGGPWITPALAQKKMVWTETAVEGGKLFKGKLPQPQVVANYYRDIAVLAFPATDAYRIPDIQGKAAYVKKHIAAQVNYPELPGKSIVDPKGIVDLTEKMDKEGNLNWNAPAGKWTILRIGYTPTGKDNHPAPAGGRGLECDKLSTAGANAMFEGLMGKLIADSRELTPKTLVSTHIDSWEVGSQNWTDNFREEFKKRRGYDLWNYLPVMTGHVVGNRETSERFLWDLRLTVSDMLVENYAGRFRELAHKHGMRLSIEAYDGVPCDEMTYGGQADEPMAEFWSWHKYRASYSCTEMTSAAHVYGKKIIGAEAFTATNAEKWLGHPANIKDLGDWAFCEGINRFVFHRYALQPWNNVRPGVSMGPWGLHYERTQTWWEMSKAWHEYLARCQYLLQQGLFVADICCVQPEGAPMRFAPPANVRPTGVDRGTYNFDGCTAEVVLKRMSVKDGRIVLPDGMSYRVLLLPETAMMTPELLKKIKQLVDGGATVIGPKKPVKSPSFSNYPACDDEVKKLAEELWGSGKISTKAPAEVLESLGVPADFASTHRSSLRYIHRIIDGAEVYFIANKTEKAMQTVAEFRVKGKQPELWHPETGRITSITAYEEKNGVTRIPLQFGAVESVFVVFRNGTTEPADRVISITRDGRELISMEPVKKGDFARHATSAGDFTITVWAKPEADTHLSREANSGIKGLNEPRNDVLYPAPGHEVWSDGDAGAGIAIGRNGICVYEHGANYFAAPLVLAAPIQDWTHVAVVYKGNRPSLYINGKLARTGLQGPLAVHGSVNVEHQREVAAFRGETAGLQQFDRALTPGDIMRMVEAGRPAGVAAASFKSGLLMDFVRGECFRSGKYIIKTSDGRSREFVVDVPAPVAISGPWKVDFPKADGGPGEVVFDTLASWHQHSNAGIRYFSGTATYRKSIDVPTAMIGNGKRLYLELGHVQIMAEVKLNGKNLGILWKEPYRVDITDTARAGGNDLEIKVANLWINRQIGDEMLPEDSERNPNGTLKKWPAWVLQGKNSPTGRFTFTTHRLWKKNDSLQPSGLLGPVVLQSAASTR